MTKGIIVCHKTEPHDTYGGRGTNCSHLLNTSPPDRGWLGNPYRLRDYDYRLAVIEKYATAFLIKIEANHEFKAAVHDLDGERVACWCRHSNESEPPCHLDVVNEYIESGEDAALKLATETLPELYGREAVWQSDD